MATEILGFLIIVGILIVFIVRRDLWNGSTASSKAEEVEEASVKMRLQMEHSADAIIARMESHIHQLESLVAAADERARVLEKQLAAVREDQERAQRKAEQEFAAMRAAQASYYPPRDDAYAAGYEEAMRRQPWPAREEYQPRVPQPQFSMRPIDEVSSVRRTDYAARERMNPRRRDDGFAEALSASMYEAQNTYRREPRRERPAPAYYENGDYGQGGYGNPYEAVPYPAESYPVEDTWEQYVEEPRRPTPSRAERGFRRTSDVPVEMVVEETPAVIVEPQVTNRRGDYLREEPEEEGPVFSPEQMEELAKTEAEVVVSSSVADVVDLPVHSDEAGDHRDAAVLNEGQEIESPEEDVHGFAEPEEMEVPEEEAREFADAEEWPPDKQQDFMEAADPEPIAAEEPFEEEGDRAMELPEEASAEFSESTQPWMPEEAGAEEGMSAAAEAAVASQEDSMASEPDEEEAPQGEIFAFTEEEELALPASNVSASEKRPGGSDVSAEALREPGHTVQNTADDSREPSPTVRARALLAQGMSPAEAARETGMGRSAVELLAQMAKSMGKTQDSD